MISVVLPSYKEEDNLKKIVPDIKMCLNSIEHEILIIDTQLPLDNTRKICVENDVSYINRENGNSYGDAVRTGIKKAKGDVIVFMDADGSHNPNDIMRLFNAYNQNKCNLVIGSRYCKGGKTDNNLILVFMSYVLNLTYRIIFHLKCKDCSNSFRLYQSDKLKKLKLECSNFDIVEEILIKLVRSEKTFKILEVPIVFRKRDEGISKRDLKKFILSYIVTIKRLLYVTSDKK